MTARNDRPWLSRHAARRMAQRNVEIDDLLPVIRFGRVIYNGGAEFYFLGRRNLPPSLQLKLEHLVGLTVVVRNGHVLTVYRNRRSPSKIRRKLKRYIQDPRQERRGFTLPVGELLKIA